MSSEQTLPLFAAGIQQASFQTLTGADFKPVPLGYHVLCRHLMGLTSITSGKALADSCCLALPAAAGQPVIC
jgi:hypothetical protein